MTKPAFRLDTSVDDRTGEIVAVYLRVREGEIAETKELTEGVAYADYDVAGSLLGIERLGPCPVEVLDCIGHSEPEPIKRFLHGAVPRRLVE
jgi:hypothetical protein